MLTTKLFLKIYKTNKGLYLSCYKKNPYYILFKTPFLLNTKLNYSKSQLSYILAQFLIKCIKTNLSKNLDLNNKYNYKGILKIILNTLKI